MTNAECNGSRSKIAGNGKGNKKEKSKETKKSSRVRKSKYKQKKEEARRVSGDDLCPSGYFPSWGRQRGSAACDAQCLAKHRGLHEPCNIGLYVQVCMYVFAPPSPAAQTNSSPRACLGGIHSWRRRESLSAWFCLVQGSKARVPQAMRGGILEQTGR